MKRIGQRPRGTMLRCIIMLTCVCAPMYNVPASADERAGIPNVVMELATSPVFVGEMPLLQVTVSARAGGEISVLRPDFWRPSHCMVVGLLDPQGRPQSIGPPPDIHFPTPLPPALEVVVDSGIGIRADVATFLWPTVPGKHRLIATLWPHPERTDVLTAEVGLDVMPLDDEHVLQRIAFKRAGKHRDILIARDGKAGVLLFSDPALQVVDRLGVFELSAKLTARLDETDALQPRIVVHVRETKSIHVLVVDFATGEVKWPRPPASTAGNIARERQ